MASTNSRISSSFFGVTLMSVLVYALTYGKFQLVAYYWGAGRMTDVFLVGQIIPFTVVQLLTHTLGTVLVPVFSELRAKEGDARAWAYVANLFNVVGVSALALTVVAVVTAPLIVGQIAPGFDGEQQSAAVLLTRIMIPSVIFNGCVTVLFGVLNTSRRFIVRQSIDVLHAATIIGLIIVLQRSLGIMAMAVATSGAAVLKLAVTVAVARREGFPFLRLLNPRERGLVTTLRLSAVIAIGTLFGYLSPVVDRILASHLPPGSLSYLEYGVMTSRAVAFVIITPLATILLTSFTELHSRGDTGQLVMLLGRALCSLSYVVYPVAAALVVFSGPVVGLLFERGAFDTGDTARTVVVLRFYSVWLFFTGLDAVASRLFYAMQRVKVPIAVGIFGMAVKVVLSFVFIGPFGYAGLALATALGSILKPMLLFAAIRSKYREFCLLPIIFSHLRILANSTLAVVCASLFYAKVVPADWASSGLAARLAALVASAVPGIATYLLGSWITKSDEQLLIWETVRSHIPWLRTATGGAAS